MRTTLFAAALVAPLTALAAVPSPAVIVDGTPTAGTADGTIGPAEYVEATLGVNAGFGGQLGPARLHVDSSDAELTFGLETPNLTDFVTIYLDTRGGGFNDTAAFQDNVDPHRAAASGVGLFNPAGSVMTFAPQFRADYALVFDRGLAVLFELQPLAPHTFVSTPAHWFAPGAVEVSVPLANLGLGQGATIAYVATLGNPLDPAGYFRSDELHGVAAGSVPAGNPGAAPMVPLAPGDFNLFTTWCADPDLDGVCADIDRCVGDDASGDTDADGVCDSDDPCYGDQSLGDSDLDGVCDLVLSASDVVPRQPMTLDAVGADPGHQVFFFASTRGLGAGPCAPGTTTCLDLRNAQQIGSARADAAGIASLTLNVPRILTPGADVWFQAVWGVLPSGPLETSNVVQRTALP